jgi:hypothetical protein
MDDLRPLVDDPQGSPLGRALLASARSDAPSTGARARAAHRLGIAAALAVGAGTGTEAGALVVAGKLATVLLALGGVVGLAMWQSPATPARAIPRSAAPVDLPAEPTERAAAGSVATSDISPPRAAEPTEAAGSAATSDTADRIPTVMAPTVAAPRVTPPVAAPPPRPRVPARPALRASQPAPRSAPGAAPAEPGSGSAEPPAQGASHVTAETSPGMTPGSAPVTPVVASPSAPPAPVTAPAAPGVAGGTTGTPAPAAGATDPGRLAAEVALVDRARTRLGAGDYPAARAALDEYHQRFPTGDLGAEADMVMIEILIAQREVDRARRLGTAFLARFPRSPLAQRVHSLLDRLPK